MAGWRIGWMVMWELIGLAATLSLVWALLGGSARQKRHVREGQS